MTGTAGVAATDDPVRRSPPGFCRDCRGDAQDGVSRCPVCGSPRLLRHPELDALAIAHVDCDRDKIEAAGGKVHWINGEPQPKEPKEPRAAAKPKNAKAEAEAVPQESSPAEAAEEEA